MLGKVSVYSHEVGAYPVFSNMKQVGESLLPSRWDALPLQGYPPPEY